MVEFGPVTGDTEGNRLAGCQETFPGQAGEALPELGESGGVEKIAQAGQDSAGGAQVQIGAVEAGLVAFEEDASGLFSGRREVQEAQFLCGERFQSRGSYSEE
jgi:hypothetical protein